MTPGARLLVLDEPTSQLDPVAAEELMGTLRRLVDEHGYTVIMSEHRLERVAGSADLVVACTAGRVEMGDPRALVPLSSSAPPVTRLARGLGWSPTPLTVREARPLKDALAALTSPPAVPAPRPQGRLLARGLSGAHGSDVVVHDVDLSIGPGEIVALLGHNGAGKTTLLRMLGGLHRPSGGSVLFDGRPPRPGKDVAMCPQDPERVLFRDTALEEIQTTLRHSEADLAAEAHLRTMGILHLSERHPRDVSAGQRMLIALGAVSATGAPVLLLDEPTRGLDHDTKGRLASFLKSWASAGNSVLFSTHDVELAAEMAPRMVLMSEGSVIADGPAAEVLGKSPSFSTQMSRIFGPGWLTPDQVLAAAGAA